MAQQGVAYDVVVIGSGLGGLSSAATLAKAGKKVLVLEQHSLPGGCATCFKRKGVRIDVGLHEMDFGSDKTDMKHIIFEKLGISEKIELIDLPGAWTVVNKDDPNDQITIPHSNTQEVLISKFPHEEKGIRKYFRKIAFQAKLVKKLPQDMGYFEFLFAPLTTLIFFAYNKFKNRKVGPVLDSIIKDSKLKRILNANIAYYHHSPYKLVWSYHAVAQHNYYVSGKYVKGGAQNLSNAFVSVIRENAGEVKTNSSVEKILVEGNRAVGVEYTNRKGQHEVRADIVIANCSPFIVYEKLLAHIDQNLIKREIERIRRHKVDTSLISLYMIFDKNPSQIYQDLDYSTFIVDAKELNADFNPDSTDLSKTAIEDRAIVFVNYSKIDSGLSDKGDKHVGVCCLFSSYDEWQMSDEKYYEKKDRVTNLILDRLSAVYPDLLGSCIFHELATPRTVERFTRSYRGSMYGYDQDNDGDDRRENWRCRSVRNLYFASAYGFPGGGFTGAIIAGYYTATRILKPYFFQVRIFSYTLIGCGIGFGVPELIRYLG